MRPGLAQKAIDASARRLSAAREAELRPQAEVHSPRRGKRDKSLTSSQLIDESQSLLSPEKQGTRFISAVAVNVESQLTHGTDFLSSDASVSSVSVTAADPTIGGAVIRWGFIIDLCCRVYNLCLNPVQPGDCYK